MTYASAETLLLLMLLALGEFSDMTLMIVLLYYKHFFLYNILLFTFHTTCVVIISNSQASLNGAIKCN